jgi:hypothetical protein
VKRQLTAQNRVSERDTVDGEPVTATAAAFGHSRPSYYQAAAAIAESGQILDWAEAQQAADPALKPAGLAGPIEEKFGARVHPRSVERALARRWEHPKSR